MDPLTGKVSSSLDLNPYSYALNASRTLSPSQSYTYRYAPMNIFEELQNNYTNTSVGDIKIQGRLAWKITPKVEATALGAIKYQSIAQELNQTDDSNLARAYRAADNLNIINRNDYLYEDAHSVYSATKKQTPLISSIEMTSYTKTLMMTSIPVEQYCPKGESVKKHRVSSMEKISVQPLTTRILSPREFTKYSSLEEQRPMTLTAIKIGIRTLVCSIN